MHRLSSVSFPSRPVYNSLGPRRVAVVYFLAGPARHVFQGEGEQTAPVVRRGLLCGRRGIRTPDPLLVRQVL